ncbi:CLUMA_CG004170, isoform A [Clunio marinus]|uniref:CLUMA_CG004170, isoform A n=1 Tax=Clunio marinus TaxID=568069 RepID=A0A1J1HVK1_9DIPT|nr:CLUMA_CG004170, isoform A [Clunio marinus]
MFKLFAFVLIIFASQGNATEENASLVSQCIIKPYTVDCPAVPACGKNLVLAKHVKDGKEVCCCKNEGDVIPCGPETACRRQWTAWRPEPYCKCEFYNDIVEGCPRGFKWDLWDSRCIADCPSGNATEENASLVSQCIIKPYTVSWVDCPAVPACGKNLVLAKHVKDGKEVCCCESKKLLRKRFYSNSHFDIMKEMSYRVDQKQLVVDSGLPGDPNHIADVSFTMTSWKDAHVALSGIFLIIFRYHHKDDEGDQCRDILKLFKAALMTSLREEDNLL